MKKLVLILGILFATSFSFANKSNTEKNSKVTNASPSFCWSFADAVEANHCGYVGCDTDWWFYAYDNCMEQAQ